jgi:hypothetical protein
LEYWFDAKKTPKLDDVKKKWQQLFQGNLQNEIFETIWGNDNGLPQSLFGDDINLNDPQDKVQAKNDFINKISSITNSFYNFIKVK